MVYIIHPNDKTTDFLENIYQPILDIFPEEIKIFRISDNTKSLEYCLKTILNCPENSSFFFLGHGASHCLHCVPEEEKILTPVFVSQGNLNQFNKHNIFSLSCESSDFFSRNRNLLKNAIGFGYIPSDFEEIKSLRESEANFLSGITKNDIEIFSELLVNIMRCSIFDYILDGLSFRELFHRIRLRINKCIVKMLLEQPANIQVVEQLYTLKNDILLVNESIVIRS
jgi:predicted RNA-binding protein YlqC (UPF0109 family)